MSDPLEIIAEIQKKHSKVGGNLDKLECIFALKQLWFDVFNYGPCSCTVHTYPGGHVFYVITNGMGEKREFPFDEIPDVLKSPHYENVRRRFKGII